MSVLTGVAVFCAIVDWERGIPYWTIFHSSFFIAACAAAPHRSPDATWALLTIGWLVTLIVVANSLIDSFQIDMYRGFPPLREMQLQFLHAYRSTIAAPIALTIPAVYLVANGSDGAPSPGRKWVIACAVTAFIDSTLLVVSLVTLFGLDWSW